MKLPAPQTRAACIAGSRPLLTSLLIVRGIFTALLASVSSDNFKASYQYLRSLYGVVAAAAMFRCWRFFQFIECCYHGPFLRCRAL